MTNHKQIQSAKIADLYEKLIKGQCNALDIFWDDIKQSGSPIIEEIHGDDKNVMVTFVYRAKDEIENVVVYGAFPSYRYKENLMEHLLDTNLWYKTYIVRNDIRFGYNYSVNDALDDDYKKRNMNFILDEFNKNKIVFLKDDEDEEDMDIQRSFVELSKVKDDVWTRKMDHKCNGTLDITRYESKSLNNTRRVWVYKPFGYDNNDNDENIKEKNNLIVLTDGFMQINILNAVTVLDNLIYHNMIPRSLCVFVDSNSDRVNELAFNKKYGELIVNEILPWARSKYNVTDKPEETLIGGVSLGALASAYIVLEFPNVFHNVLAQSGSFFWDNQWLINRYIDSEKVNSKFYLNVGFLEDRPYDDEPVMRDSIDKLRDVLLNKGYEVAYDRLPSGHDYLSWGEGLANGLIALMGKK
ncbi:enterochelin esterase [Hathewaya proteolytica DSM 3090]|uniref:Enterochelin esterase n=1 Tax=Hathewaya proteolytica DSM 3090 TaxID=1121331 RepID=A0A1M6JR83_9CLOT|nr:alpha/beta hydrolase-fold protein [Hathewaya proteolytica]SHJ49211.1 enterochelin esterase [Hathewaya proteolytica DSM 3090]